jgi:broad specificity phosphatase PhoE
MPGANADEYERLMKKDPEKLQNLIQDDPDRFEEMQNDWLNAENIEEINIENIEETGEGFQNLSENRPDVLDQIRKKHPEKFNRMAEAWNKM